MEERKLFSIASDNRFCLDHEFVRQFVGKQPKWGPVGRVTYLRTYSRPLTDAQMNYAFDKFGLLVKGSEEFWQTVQRVVEGVWSIFKQTVRSAFNPWDEAEAQEKAQEMFRRMWDFKFLPPGRGMWFMGTEALELKGSAALNNCFVGSEKLITQEYGPTALAQVADKTVTVLTADGWQSASVRAFGKQTVQRVTFAPANPTSRGAGWAKMRSNLRHDVTVTPNHRWLTLNRGEVTDLRVGDIVPAQINCDTGENEMYARGRVHGLIFGDGTAGYQYVNGQERAYHIRLCGDKARNEVHRFDNVTYPDSYNGDPYAHIRSRDDLKAFPSASSQTNPDYLRGFLDGWLVADGSIKPDGSTWRLASQHPEAETWLRDHAAIAGRLLTGVSTDATTETNLCARKHPLNVYSLATHGRMWQVTAIEPLDEAQPVYCAQVPSTRAFALASGVYTGNCGFVSTANIGQHFAHPFVVLMDFLMLGVGMGFDTRGVGKVTIVAPEVDSKWIFTVPDTREGWVLALDTLLNAFVGVGKMPLAFDYSRIRAEGMPLKTFGGTASGAQPLIDMLEGIRVILTRRIGHTITKTDIVDIKNMIGKCVVAGNVRRSSEIAIDEDGDDEFLGLKDPSALITSYMAQEQLAENTPGWSVLQQDIAEHVELQRGRSVLSKEFMALQDGIDGLKKAQKDLLIANPAWVAEQAKIDAHPLFTHRWASNNTVLCRAGQDFTRLAEMTVRNGEPGYGFLETIRTRGRLIDPPDDKDQFVMGFNPCTPAGTRILTRDGYKNIETLVGVPVDVWNGENWATVTPRVTGHDQPLVRVSLSDGTSLVCTTYHEWLVASFGSGGERRVRAMDLRPGDRMSKYNMPVVETGRTWEDAYRHGFFCGDGQDNGHSKGALLYGEKQKLLPYLATRPTSPLDAYERIYVGFDKNLPDKFTVPMDLDVSSRLAWLAGLLDADGAVLQNPNSVHVQLSSTHKNFLLNVRLLLTTLGVQAKIAPMYAERIKQMPDGHGGTASYRCQASWRLLLNAADTYRLVQLGLNTRRLVLPARKPQRDARRFVTVTSVESEGVAPEVYCFTEPHTHRGTFEGIVTGQCAEQPLEDNELCCLVETFPTNHASLEDFLTTLKFAFMYAKCVTLIPTHRPETNAVMTRNRRIGTSMAGVWEMYEMLGMTECVRWWDTGFKEIKRWDKTYSHWLGINESSRHTTIKPGGTIPLLAGKEGGMKIPTSEHYMRTIRMDHLHPLVEACRAAGYRVEPDRTTPRTMVVYFPVRDPAVATGKVRTAREVSIWEQVAVLVALQTYWSDNMVSNTITFQPHEARDVAKVLSMYSDRLKTISFLPLSDHGYLQAPYIPCSLTEYVDTVAVLKPLDVDGINAHDTDDKYCSGGLCEAPPR